MSKKEFQLISKVLVVVSKLDIAGLNMQNRLMEQLDFHEIDFLPYADWPKGEYRFFQSDTCSILQIPNNQIKTDYFNDKIKFSSFNIIPFNFK